MPRLIAWVAKVAELVGVDVSQPRRGAGAVDHPGHRVPVLRSSVLPGQEQWVPGRDVPGAVGVDDLDDAWVQRQVAVLVELADGNVEPVGGADEHDRVAGQGGVLPDPQSGA